MMQHWRHLYGLIPSNPRCVSCHSPFAGIGGAFGRIGLIGSRPSAKNPRFCTACDAFNARYAGGAEVVLTMLFVDVRGSTTIAENMNAAEFSRLMNRFYEATINVLVQADAFIDKLVGDEVTALFIPGYAGKEHARKAVEAGKALLHVTGYEEPAGPWDPGWSGDSHRHSMGGVHCRGKWGCRRFHCSGRQCKHCGAPGFQSWRRRSPGQRGDMQRRTAGNRRTGRTHTGTKGKERISERESTACKMTSCAAC